MKQFWVGADVRWCGPQRAGAENHLALGERLTVVDAGRHHIGSFEGLTTGQRRQGWPLVVRRSDGTVLRVDPDHVDLVAPNHPLQPEADGTHARWWVDQLDDWNGKLTVGAFVPRSLPSVCVILHPWSEDDHELTWDAVADRLGLADRAAVLDLLGNVEIGTAQLPITGPADPPPGRLGGQMAASLVEVLGTATSTPDDVFVAVWEGWGDTPAARFPGAARVELPWRTHFLLRGPLEGVQTSVSAIPSDQTPASGLWWPADRAWLVHTEIDFQWTFVAGAPELIDALTATAGLECLGTHHDAVGNTLPASAGPSR